MQNQKFSAFLTLFTIFTATLLATGSPAAAQTEIVLSNFESSTAEDPAAAVIFDSAGNLYGTTFLGGAYAGGTVFELTPESIGVWTQQFLYNFNSRGRGGFYPIASLIFDSAGNLYGTTSSSYDGGDAYGTVFKLTRQVNGNWTETVLHEFVNKMDGRQPQASLIFDSRGNLYGTTVYGGVYSGGIAFQLTPQADGKWTEKVLHNFGHGSSDGTEPTGSLIFDAARNLYGTLLSGGSYGNGAVFELSPNASGGWTERILEDFANSTTNGKYPYGNLIFDAAGDLYGTTGNGGTYGQGVVYKLSPNAGGDWTEELLYSFAGGPDGGFPVAGVVFDAVGNLYGTADDRGSGNAGTVFELSPNGVGGWTQNTLYDFTGGADGGTPEAGVILDSAGNLYGTTVKGGNGGGTVFEILR